LRRAAGTATFRAVAPHQSTPQPRIGVISLGCDKNTVDTERYLAELAAHGAHPTADLADADVILVNTCGFIDAAKRESIDALIAAARLKIDGRCQAVVAVGCMVERHRAELEAAIPEVDAFVGTSDTDRLVSTLMARGLLAPAPALVHPGVRIFAGDRPHVRYLKVSEGCDHGCAFCAIPLMRGRHRSFGVAELIREAQLLELQGARELNLVAQDLAHYGRDRRDGAGLAELLDALVAETSVPWIRLLYLYSAGLTDGVLDRLAREPRLLHYLDIPIQHGSDAVLRRMRRPERAAGIRSTVARVRDAIPDVAIRTTCIVGFPGETEADVERLLELLEEVQFERVGVFAYSAQEGTHAWALGDDVPEEVKAERLERATERVRLITAERYEQRLGRPSHALVDRAPGLAGEQASPADPVGCARLTWQADDIDGLTHLDRSDLAPGTIVEVDVDDVVDDYDFRARVRRVVDVPSAAAGTRAGRALPVAAGPGGFAPTRWAERAGSYGR